MKKIKLLAYLLGWPAMLFAQTPTVGLIQSNAGVYEGYTLMAPMFTNNDERTFLLDNCGDVVHEWPTTGKVGLSSYFLPDGRLLRAVQTGNTVFTAGGSGGKVRIWDWTGNQLWDYQVSDSVECQHHDVEYLPNGNVLILLWSLKDSLECVARGRDTANLTQGVLWSEKIIEVMPIGPDSGAIVWEWDVWDHLIQDADSTKPDYGDPADYPERWNLNYLGWSAGGKDWLHANAIAYNPVLDQVIMSCRLMHEVYVIDHSTTTQEAAGHTGGNSGKGGDILYRWGNPEAYNHGTANDKRLFAQHNAHWVPDSIVHGGRIMVFNNGNGRQPVEYSTVDMIIPPLDSLNQYVRLPGLPYGPDSAVWSYAAPNPPDFYSKFIAGAQQLENGNVIICDGTHGTFFEVDSAKNELWRYVCPMTTGGLVNQGDTLMPFVADGTNNWVFRVQKYGPGYPGLAGKTLTSTGPLELNPWPSNCTTSLSGPGGPILFTLYPNPTEGTLYLSGGDRETPFLRMTVRDLAGRLLDSREVVWPGSTYAFDLGASAGVYLVEVTAGSFRQVFKVVKR